MLVKLLCLLLLVLNNPQSPSLSEGKKVELSNTIIQEYQSKINKVHYKLYISLPNNYYSSNKNYPVVYLLDADYSFALAKQIGDHLSDRNRIQKSIFIGISYSEPNNYKINRTRDYTPTFVPDGGYGSEFQKYSGGAEQFYQFMEKELIPQINKRFRVNNNKTLIGHSFGGLYTSYLLVNHSKLFNNYVIVSPSLWYDNKYLIKLLSQKSNDYLQQKVRAYLVIGSQENKGDYRMIDDLVLFNKMLLKKDSSKLVLNISIIKDLDHDTVFPMGLTIGLIKVLGINP